LGLEYLGKATELDSGSRASLAYAWALSRQGDPEESLSYYKELLQRFPDDPQVLNDAGYMLVELDQDLDLALASLGHALELEPTSPYIQDSYGWALFKHKRVAEAIPFLEWAARRSPESPEVQQHLAQALAHLGRVQESKEASRRSLRPKAPGLLQNWLWSFQDHFAPDFPRP
jgi:predicted Zn-dependent protease